MAPNNKPTQPGRKPEATERPRFGDTLELKADTLLITTVNPDGSQTVERVPASQAQKKKPKPSN